MCKKTTFEAYNSTPQEVVANGILSFADYEASGCGIKAIGSTGIRISRSGKYLVLVSSTIGGTGNVSLQLFQDGTAVPYAYAMANSTGTTNPQAIMFQKIITVNESCRCVNNATTLTLRNVGVDATVEDVIVDVIRL